LPGTSGAIQTAHGNPGGEDLFVSRFSGDLNVLRKTTFFGGSGDETLGNPALALNPYTGEAILAGDTTSATLAGTTGAFQTANAGGRDIFVARLSSDLIAADHHPTAFTYPTRFGVLPGSLQATDPIKIAGFGANTPVDTFGSPGSAMCMDSGNTCAACDLTGGWVKNTSAAVAGAAICFRHLAAPTTDTVAETTIVFGDYSTLFRTITIGPAGAGCRLDIDGNNAVDALTDGLMLLRAMFGLTGTSVTNAAVGSGATRSTWTQIRNYLNGSCGTAFN
jgi:hypothetical protein